MKRAVFLDRDGVLNVYLPGDYVKSPAELRLLPGVAQAVRKLNDAQTPVYLISNQQGVAKGLMTIDDLQTVDRALRDHLAAEAGATLAQSYYCTHAKADDCDCRKPKGGLLLRAAREHGIDFAASTFVGDTETDAQAARAAGVGQFILALSGKFRDCPEAAQDTILFPIPPDQTVPDLTVAVDAILSALAPKK